MRKETIEYTYLQYDECTPEQKKQFIDKHRDINVTYDGWWDGVYDEWCEKLKALGFSDIEINFTGFWSQGDGASFTAKHERGEVYRINYRYYHYNSVKTDDDKLTEQVRDLCQELYRDLEKTYDYLISDEAVIETIKSNEMEWKA